METNICIEVEKILDRHEKVKPLPGVMPYYEREDSRIPEKIRISFSDGSTAVYVIHVEQPAPQIVESINIIRKWVTGYPAQQRRRRRAEK